MRGDGAGQTLSGQDVGRRPKVNLELRRGVDDSLRPIGQPVLQPPLDIVLVERDLRAPLNPFQPTYKHTAGVRQDIRGNPDAAIAKCLVGISADRNVGDLKNCAGRDLLRVLRRDLPAERRRLAGDHVTGMAASVLAESVGDPGHLGRTGSDVRCRDVAVRSNHRREGRSELAREPFPLVHAQLAHPDRWIFAITGDGDFMMNVQEMETARRLNADITVMVWNDGGYGLISWKRDDEFGRHSELSFGNPKWLGLADCFGEQGQVVDRSWDLAEEIRFAIEHRGLSLLVVPIDYRQNRLLGERLGAIPCPI